MLRILEERDGHRESHDSLEMTAELIAGALILGEVTKPGAAAVPLIIQPGKIQIIVSVDTNMGTTQADLIGKDVTAIDAAEILMGAAARYIALARS